jgi:hypothetical protein
VTTFYGKCNVLSPLSCSLGFFKVLPKDMIVPQGKKDLNYSLKQLNLLLLRDMIVPRGNEDLNYYPRQFKFFFLRDMIVSQGKKYLS